MKCKSSVKEIIFILDGGFKALCSSLLPTNLNVLCIANSCNWGTSVCQWFANKKSRHVLWRVHYVLREFLVLCVLYLQIFVCIYLYFLTYHKLLHSTSLALIFFNYETS